MHGDHEHDRTEAMHLANQGTQDWPRVRPTSESGSFLESRTHFSEEQLRYGPRELPMDQLHGGSSIENPLRCRRGQTRCSNATRPVRMHLATRFR
eukprot:4969478-Amphidinium_carterae.1